jgi:hypothetical protein
MWRSSLGLSQGGKVMLQVSEDPMQAVDHSAGDYLGLFEVVRARRLVAAANHLHQKFSSCDQAVLKSQAGGIA